MAATNAHHRCGAVNLRSKQSRFYLYLWRHQRPASEMHEIRIALRENVNNRAPLNTFYTLARFGLLLNVDITILYPNTQTLTVYM